MEIIRATNTNVVEYLEPMLLQDDDVPKEVFLRSLREAMIHTPANVLVLVAHENDEILAFILAYAPLDVGYCFVSQAWIKQGQPMAVANKLLARVKSWAFDMVGRGSLRCETTRTPEVFTRRWGFKQISTTLELRDNNEQEGWTENNIVTDESAAGRERSAVPVPEQDGNTASEPVRGPAEPEPGPTVRSGGEVPEPVQSVQPTDVAAGNWAGNVACFTDCTSRPSDVSSEPEPGPDKQLHEAGSAEPADAKLSAEHRSGD